MAPYVQINVNGPNAHRPFEYNVTGKEKLCYKDAVFISPHKFVGGPGSSGILIAKKALLYDRTPDRVGGGPVFFVNAKEHEFVANTEELEEAGTPGILQDIRAGLVFQLKEQVGEETIRLAEERAIKLAMERLAEIPNLFLLGNNNLPKVPIFSFVVRTRAGAMLHPFFVSSLLNDVFGI